MDTPHTPETPSDDTPPAQAGGFGAEPAGYPDADPAAEPEAAAEAEDGDDPSSDDAVRYYAAKAEVARLAVRLGIEPGPGGGAPVGAWVAADAAGAAGQGGHPTGFGRGWIPAGRDIGMPGELHGLPKPVHPELVEGLSFSSGPAQGRPDEMGEGAPRTPRSTDFTPDRRARFLHVLAEQGDVRVACAREGISPQTVYLARRRDAVFGAGWAAALVLAREHAEQVLASRAIAGVVEPVFYAGEKIGEKVRHDPRWLLSHLGRLDARCADERAAAHATRFDEILALVAGADYPAQMADRPAGANDTADPILPMARERYVVEGSPAAAEGEATGEATEQASGETGGETADEIGDETGGKDRDAALWAAQDRAAAEWEVWDERVEGVAVALAAGELPVVAEEDGAAEAEEPRWAPACAAATVEEGRGRIGEDGLEAEAEATAEAGRGGIGEDLAPPSPSFVSVSSTCAAPDRGEPAAWEGMAWPQALFPDPQPRAPRIHCF